MWEDECSKLGTQSLESPEKYYGKLKQRTQSCEVLSVMPGETFQRELRAFNSTMQNWAIIERSEDESSQVSMQQNTIMHIE